MFSLHIIDWSQGTVEHHGRFNDEFGCEEESDEKDDDGKPSKPRDWEPLFGEGNNDDTFVLGIKYTRYILFNMGVHASCLVIDLVVG